MNIRTAGLMVLLLGMSSAAEAQAPAATFDGLGALVRPREMVAVTDAKGATIRGMIASISSDTLEIAVDGQPMRFDVSHVESVSAKRRDSLLNGAVGGFAVGAVTGAILVLLEGGQKQGWVALRARDFLVPTALLGGAIGLVVGTSIDVSIKKTHLLYNRRKVGSTPRIAIVPTVQRGGIGAFVVLGL